MSAYITPPPTPAQRRALTQAFDDLLSYRQLNIGRHTHSGEHAWDDYLRACRDVLEFIAQRNSGFVIVDEKSFRMAARIDAFLEDTDNQEAP